jgi:hypothetical protein
MYIGYVRVDLGLLEGEKPKIIKEDLKSCRDSGTLVAKHSSLFPPPRLLDLAASDGPLVVLKAHTEMYISSVHTLAQERRIQP